MRCHVHYYYVAVTFVFAGVHCPLDHCRTIITVKFCYCCRCLDLWIDTCVGVNRLVLILPTFAISCPDSFQTHTKLFHLFVSFRCEPAVALDPSRAPLRKTDEIIESAWECSSSPHLDISPKENYEAVPSYNFCLYLWQFLLLLELVIPLYIVLKSYWYEK